MARRRLVVVIAVAALAVGAAWWVFSDRLSAEERWLVGMWRQPDCPVSPEIVVSFFDSDRQFYVAALREPRRSGSPPACWSIRDGTVVIDPEPSRLRRALRPILPRLGVAVPAADHAALEWVSDDEMIQVDRYGERTRWVRVRE
jgi:hypothetical protein